MSVTALAVTNTPGIEPQCDRTGTLMPTPSTPFANGTEGEAWMDKWCQYCANDHDIHTGDGGGCDLIVQSMVMGDDWRWPDAWLPEPDDGKFYLPSRMVCGMFTPCEPCGGDPGAEDRKERVAQVQVYWRNRVTGES